MMLDGKTYGAAPVVVETDLELASTPELMFVQDMPLKLAGSHELAIPPNLDPFFPLIYRAYDWCRQKDYLYINAKHIYHPPFAPVNRPGWHCDSFGYQDMTFLWYDSVPTEFCIQPFDLSTDDVESMVQMEEQVKLENIYTYPPKTLLKMYDTSVHRPNISTQGGFRIFVKLVISEHKFNLQGNAHNHLLDYNWDMKPRGANRNLQLAHA